ncbi:hypothetical protein RchiOBHm_Chr7g0193771 [Rosa chinensis]|uniref:Uncharacterized protein n=1 Tax=Rosa chinensis TaxID=74649 RepID=A0A2P6P5W7_ROSCH|nr:hypothetical protein RchiOBHm_Chr7g0193771 [Rosa chinensis]
MLERESRSRPAPLPPNKPTPPFLPNNQIDVSGFLQRNRDIIFWETLVCS